MSNFAYAHTHTNYLNICVNKYFAKFWTHLENVKHLDYSGGRR